jgi:tungstate transport system ATP-binding protein
VSEQHSNRIDATGIRQLYGGRAVLDVPSLSINGGETLVMIGPSGAGKSTLLRIMALLEAPAQGRIMIDGTPVSPGASAQLPVRRRFGVVMQRPTLFRASVLRNAAYGLHLRGIPQVVAREEARRALAEVGLLPLENQPAHTLSGGEAQRLAIARALVTKPDFLFMDEPTANLDPTNVGLIEDVIRKVRRETGTAVVFVTHNMRQAERLADRVVFLWNGEPVESATRDVIFTSPQNPLTRDFVAGKLVY